MSPTLIEPPAVDLAFVDHTIQRIGSTPDTVIPILQALQEHYHYLPKDALQRVTQLTAITPAQITGVSTFYAQFRHKPAGKHILRVCHGTACHVKGSQLVHDAIIRHLKLDDGQDTDTDGLFTIERVGCIGCCTLAPVIQVGTVTYGYRAADNAHQALRDYLDLAGTPEHQHISPPPSTGTDLTEIRVGCGSCCIAGGAHGVRVALEQAVHRNRLNAIVKPVGCVGMCHQTPMVEIGNSANNSLALYAKVTSAEADRIVRKHFKPRGFFRRIQSTFSNALDHLWTDDNWEPIERHAIDHRDQPVCDFLGRQRRIATEYCGSLDPLDLDEYLRHNGFDAATTTSNWSANQIINQITQSGLRGRGGAGFPTGQKWSRVAAATMAFMASPPASTTSRPTRWSPGSSATAHQLSPPSAPKNPKARKSSPSPAKSSVAA
jgi:NADH-quinone oxidoreductase subunit F